MIAGISMIVIGSGGISAVGATRKVPVAGTESVQGVGPLSLIMVEKKQTFLHRVLQELQYLCLA